MNKIKNSRMRHKHSLVMEINYLRKDRTSESMRLDVLLAHSQQLQPDHKELSS